MGKYHSDLRRELEELKRKAAVVFGAGQSRRTVVRGTVPGDSVQAAAGGGALERLVPGEKAQCRGESFYRVLVEAGAVWDDAENLYRGYLETLSDPFPVESKALRPLAVLKDASREEVCYLDLETTGLSMVPLFLIGLMYSDGERLVVDQLFARDYTEARAILCFVSEFLERFTIVVTFNGIAFDLPFLAERMIVSGLDFSPPAIHLDLLPVARRALRGRTPNHKLQTLETYLCKRKRIGDIPGSEIPDVYHDFVRSGDATCMAGVFHHNRLDLLTMLQLVTVFLSGDF
jgi:uncharacterized protein YprB with RNaseH-like and TPR domain